MERTRGRLGRTRVFLWLVVAGGGALAALLFLATPTQAAPLSGANADMDRLCVLSAAIADRTAQANDATVNDITMGKSSLPTDPTAVYFGMDAPFNEITVNVGTPGTGGTLDWHYKTAIGWTALTINDNTNDFKIAGTNAITFTPHANWAKSTVHADCGGERFYVRSATGIQYTVAPQATQISAQTFNLRVRVEDELGGALVGLVQGAFRVSAGSDNSFFAFREIGSGAYELSLAADASDTNYDLEIEQDGFVTNVDATTGTLGSGLSDLEGSPVTLQFAYKVTGITPEGSSTALSGASVSAGDGFSTPCAEAASAWYCAVPIEDSGLNVQIVKDGYVSDASVKFATDRVIHVDSQRTVSVRDLRATVKVVVLGQTGLTNVVWEKSVNGGAFTTLVPLATAANIAYFPLGSSDTGVVLRATKNGVSADTGEPFAPSPASQLERAVALTSSGAVPSSAPSSRSTVTSVAPASANAKAPSAKASAPAEAGPVVALSWTSTNLPSGAHVELWVLEGPGEPRLHHRAEEPSGRVAFYGVASHTYYFFARTTAASAPAAVPNLAAANADATTRVLSDRLAIAPAALALLGPVPLGESFHAVDEDADGFPEAFLDSSGRLSLVRVVGRERLDPAMLLRGAEPRAFFLWNLLNNDLSPVQAADGRTVGSPRGDAVRIQHEVSGGWVLVSTADTRAGDEIARVRRGDGSEVPGDLYWQEAGRALVLDNQAREYEISYARPAPDLLRWVLVAVGALVGCFALGFLAWLHAPGLETLLHRKGPMDGAVWTLRHCRRCHAPLPRAHRLVRALHRCESSEKPEGDAVPAPPLQIPLIPK